MDVYRNNVASPTLSVLSGRNSRQDGSKNKLSEQGMAGSIDANPFVAENSSANTNEDVSTRHDIESHLERSVTLVFWYKAQVEPIRLQHMIPSFPYFQLSRFASLTSDLGLSSTTYLDTFIPESKQWDQHTISSVRVVTSNQRLLYRIRKSLLEGLSDNECLGLKEEVEKLTSTNPSLPPSSSLATTTSVEEVGGHIIAHVKGNGKGPLKRSAPSTPESAPPSKFQLTDGYQRQQPYPAYLSAPSAPNGGSTSNSPHVDASVSGPVTQHAVVNSSSPNSPNLTANSPSAKKLTVSPAQSPSQNHTRVQNQSQNQSHSQGQGQGVETVTNAAGSSSTPYYNNTSPNSNTQYLYQTPVSYSTTSASTIALPPYLIHPHSSAPQIPYHPHPPLKRWPNDYTVSELSAGFHAMEALVQQSPNGAAMTQRTAFERVFGSRYVKSTVCRHRGVWRKAPQPIREEYEAMGEDERACWGEFVRRVEGRPPGRAGMGPISIPVHEALTMGGPSTLYHQHTIGPHGIITPNTNAGMIQVGVDPNVSQRAEEEEEAPDQPVMDSLQSPSEHGSSVTKQSPMQNANIYDPSLTIASSSQS